MANVLYDSLFARHAGSPTPFLISGSGDITSHDDFLKLTARFANALVAQGVAPGARVAAQIPKSVEALGLYAACLQAGAVFLPLNPAYTPGEVGYFVDDAAPKLILGDDRAYPALRPIAARAGATLMTLNADGGGSFARCAAHAPDTFETVPRGPDDLAAFLYTSGTTGRSKGAMLAHGNLLSNAEVLKDCWRFTADDRLLHALPIFHTHGLFVATNITLLAGGAMIFLPAFKLDGVIAALPRATAMMGVPTFYTRLLEDPRFTSDLVRHMRLFISGSAPLLAETHESFEARTGHRILERYGMTETNMITSNPYDGPRRAGTVGFALPGISVRVADAETGDMLEDGQIGVIELKGPNVFQGYWRMPEKTRSEFRDDGYFITGDLGLIDDQGYLQIVGRAKDLIISGGFNVYPKEIELLLDEQEGVKESAVIGVPHPDFGEAVVGIVVPENSQGVDMAQILDAIASDIARFKQPKKLFVQDELPRNTMGKVQKSALRERYKEIFSSIQNT
ncbi:Long-chain-fatty-acid--CoA ligase [hydrothermal vent metagenome]|uniref:Long-chain-fatty-acid--CoA ligase n=1 Tax=hydrothermal vent metagenome TaxID=652676 RepID=A0A3B0TIF9_9ZZZZ